MTREDFMKLGARIKTVRKKRGYTQEQLAEAVGCSVPYISYIERGRKCLSVEMLVLIANELCVSSDEILHDSLENTIAVSNHDFAVLLSDCNSFESRVLLDIVSAANDSLRTNQRLR